MKRGDVVYCAAPDYYGKVRPGVIVQSNKYLQEPPSFTICLLTGDVLSDSAVRVTILPSKSNGLEKASQIMIDKVMSLPSARIKNRVGALTAQQIRMVDEALRDWLSL